MSDNCSEAVLIEMEATSGRKFELATNTEMVNFVKTLQSAPSLCEMGFPRYAAIGHKYARLLAAWRGAHVSCSSWRASADCRIVRSLCRRSHTCTVSLPCACGNAGCTWTGPGTTCCRFCRETAWLRCVSAGACRGWLAVWSGSHMCRTWSDGCLRGYQGGSSGPPWTWSFCRTRHSGIASDLRCGGSDSVTSATDSPVVPHLGLWGSDWLSLGSAVAAFQRSDWFRRSVEYTPFPSEKANLQRSRAGPVPKSWRLLDHGAKSWRRWWSALQMNTAGCWPRSSADRRLLQPLRLLPWWDSSSILISPRPEERKFCVNFLSAENMRYCFCLWLQLSFCFLSPCHRPGGPGDLTPETWTTFPARGPPPPSPKCSVPANFECTRANYSCQVRPRSAPSSSWSWIW